MAEYSAAGSRLFNITFNGAYSYRADTILPGLLTREILRHGMNTLYPRSTTPTSTPVIYVITASADANGSISPSGSVNVNEGADQSFTIIPDPGYQIADVLVDGVSVGALSSYTFTSVQANHIVSVSFEAAEPNPITFVGNVGSAVDGASGATLSIPVGVQGVSAGNTVVVGFASRGAATYNQPVVTDSKGNLYDLATVAVTYQHGRSYIYFAHVDTALNNGDAITVTTSSVPSRVAVASAFSGLLAVNPLDQALGNPPLSPQTTQQGNNPSVGPTGTTAASE